MTGEDQPRPGMATFQAMLSFSLQVTGSPTAGECPCPPGPRNSGHSTSAVFVSSATQSSPGASAITRTATSAASTLAALNRKQVMDRASFLNAVNQLN